jgi:hypothetical protein
MIQISNLLPFNVPLSFEAHSLAQQNHKLINDSQKAKQVYLNTLSVYAVNFYLSCLGFKTEIEQSDCRNPICLQFMNVADLAIAKIGKLECRPVLPNARSFKTPPEAQADRIAYVAVQMSQTLKEATILGFTPTAAAEIPLDRLRSLAEFPNYLARIQQATSQKKATHLRNWFEEAFETGWQTVETLLGTNSKNLALVREKTRFGAEVKRAKLLDLGMQLGDRCLILAIAISQESIFQESISQDSDETVKVLVQVHPNRGYTYLPSDLELVMLSETGEILQEVRSRNQDNYIQLKRFSAQTGDSFKIRVAFNEISITENFLL